jgi:hypothetical protein
VHLDAYLAGAGVNLGKFDDLQSLRAAVNIDTYRSHEVGLSSYDIWSRFARSSHRIIGIGDGMNRYEVCMNGGRETLARTLVPGYGGQRDARDGFRAARAANKLRKSADGYV